MSPVGHFFGGQDMPWQCCNGQRSLEGQQPPSGTGARSPFGQNSGSQNCSLLAHSRSWSQRYTSGQHFPAGVGATLPSEQDACGQVAGQSSRGQRRAEGQHRPGGTGGISPFGQSSTRQPIAAQFVAGQRLVSGQQLPSGIGALDPSGHLLVLHLSTSHPIRFSLLASSRLETLGSHGRKLIAEPLILPCTTKAVDKLLPRRVITTIPNIFPLFVLCFVLCLISLPLSHIDSIHH